MKDKKNASTAEERLKEALVPKEEQPYELPGNWAWVRLGSLVILNPARPKINILPSLVSFIPMTAVSDVTGMIVCNESRPLIEVSKGYTCFSEGDILFAKITPCMENGKSAIAENLINEIGFGSTEFYVFRVQPSIDRKFLFHLIRSVWFRNEAKKHMSGAVGQMRVRKDFLQNYALALPPLAEQKRIVERIESLFSRLDEAKELIQSSLERSQLRRSSILHAAFTGQLTEQWRKENNVSQETWQKKTLGAFCDSFQYGTSKKSQNSGRIAVIRMGNLQQGEISWDNLAFTDDDEDIDKYLLRKGDVLFNRTNSPELVGKTSIYRGEQPAIFAGYLIRINYGHELTGEFLNYLLNSMSARDYCNAVKTDGVNQSNINAQKLAAFPCSIPSLPEQHEIVRILDSLLQKEDAARELCEGVLEKIELTRKSILAQAFRGHLGTHNPDDPSVVALIKE